MMLQVVAMAMALAGAHAGGDLGLRAGDRISFFGDSTTWQGGYLTMMRADLDRWPATRRLGVALVNRGINGGKSNDLRDGCRDLYGCTQPPFVQVLRDDRAAVAVVDIGINDIGRAPGGNPPDVYERCLRDMVKAARRAGVPLVLATPTVIGELPRGQNALDAKLDAYSEIVREVAKDTGSAFVDLRKSFFAALARLRPKGAEAKASGILTYDGTHMLDAGNRLMADLLFEGLAKALKGRGRGAEPAREARTLPHAQRPAWLRRDGIVMAGNWEPLIARARRHNGTFEPTAEQLRGYEHEHTEGMVDELQKLGVNFIMTHGYKGAGLVAEKPGLEDAKRLAAIAHRRAMRVGLYIFSGTLLPEKLRLEHPESIQWEVKDEKGDPVYYPWMVKYRHFLNRNHPVGQEHLKDVIDFAVREVKTDLLHFDNYDVGPGYEQASVDRFRAHLGARYQPSDLGLDSFDKVLPPPSTPDWRPEWKPTTALHRAWIDFSCGSLAESFSEIGAYARSLRPDLLLECNPGAFMRESAPLDHARLLRHGEAVWHDVVPFAPDASGVTANSIRAYKTAQAMDNMAFVYLTQPIHAAESLAYNTDCLGCIAWFEGGRISRYPDTSDPVVPGILPYVRFFHARRAYYREAVRVAEVGVVRSFASHAFAPDSAYAASALGEEGMIRTKLPWMPIYDHQWDRLAEFGCISLIGADCLTDRQVAQIGVYVRNGGGVVYSEGAGAFDERMARRATNPFDALAGPRVVKVAPGAELGQALSAALGRRPALAVKGADSLTTELTEQPDRKRRLVHLVNYRNVSAKETSIDLGLPTGWRAKRVVLLRPEAARAERLSFRQIGERVAFVVPQVDLYALISVEAGD